MALLTIAEISESLVVSESTVRRLIRERSLKAIKVGRQLRVRPEDLEAYLRDHEVALDQPRAADGEEQES